MKINPTKLRERMESSGVGPGDLASAVADGDSRKQAELAEKKIRNWMAGRDHPKLRGREASAIAERLGCGLTDIVMFDSRYRWARSSPRKARLVADMIKGRPVDEAMALLSFSPKRAAVMVRKTLDAAVADAAGADASPERLVVSVAKVDGGVIIKRFQPKDRGRAHPIEKRTSHITVAVEEVA